uniref:Oxidation resistance 1 n=1 Tax=Mus musculus TaxID=10090 RepID=A0A2R8VHS5_MOUSE
MSRLWCATIGKAAGAFLTCPSVSSHWDFQEAVLKCACWSLQSEVAGRVTEIRAAGLYYYKGRHQLKAGCSSKSRPGA